MAKVDLAELLRIAAAQAKLSSSPATYFREQRYLPATKEMITLVMNNNGNIPKGLNDTLLRSANNIARDLAKIVNNSKPSFITDITNEISMLGKNNRVPKGWNTGRLAGRKAVKKAPNKGSNGVSVQAPQELWDNNEPIEITENWYSVNSTWIVMAYYVPASETEGWLALILNRKKNFGAYYYPNFRLDHFRTLISLPWHAGSYWWSIYGIPNGFKKVSKKKKVKYDWLHKKNNFEGYKNKFKAYNQIAYSREQKRTKGFVKASTWKAKTVRITKPKTTTTPKRKGGR